MLCVLKNEANTYMNITQYINNTYMNITQLKDTLCLLDTFLMSKGVFLGS